MKRSLTILLTVALAFSLAAVAQQPGKKEAAPAKKAHEYNAFAPADVKWGDAPNALPAGAQLAVLEGNPFQPGSYVMRVKMPDGYRIPQHWHPRTEHITVLAGAFNVGMGERFDRNSAKKLTVGSFAYIEPKMLHFAFTTGETIIQLHGDGPWEIVYANPADDPRKR